MSTIHNLHLYAILNGGSYGFDINGFKTIKNKDIYLSPSLHTF